jgi:glutamine amidotransferase
MRWNQLNVASQSALTQGFTPDDYVYFVHSFAAPPALDAATTDYGGEFSALVRSAISLERSFTPASSVPARAPLANIAGLAVR